MKRAKPTQSPSSRITLAICSARRWECAEASGVGAGRMGSAESGIAGPAATLRILFSRIAADYSMRAAVVLITGAARRIGAAIARRLHGDGARVVVHCYRSRAHADALAQEFNRARAHSCAVVQGDLLDIERLPSLVEEAASAFGRLDALVNNASSFYATPFGSIGAREWDDLIGTNLRAPLLLAQAAASHLRAQRGAIVK